MALTRLTKVPTSLTTDIVDSATDAVELIFNNVDNTRDLDKPVSNLVQSRLLLKADINSPTFTGWVSAPTVTDTFDNSTRIATTAFVQTKINNLISGAPGLLDTFDEIANALGDDPNFATTITNLINTKVSLYGAAFTGRISLPASSGSFAPFNIPHGTTPVAVINGDIWTSNSGIHARVNGQNRTFIHDGNINDSIEAIAFTGFEKGKTANYTVVKADQGDLITATSSTPITFTMGSVASLGQGFLVAFKNLGSGTLTLAAGSGDNIDGQPSISLITGESIMISCNGISYRSVFKNIVNAAALTNLNASALATGTVPADRLPSTLTGNSLVNTTFIGAVTGLNKTHVGLPNVDNTADLNKPISSATQTALDGKISEENILQSNGVVLRDPAFRTSTTATETGTIAIQLPAWNNSMLRMNVSIYDFIADRSFSVEISGYPYVTEGWYNTSARIIDSPSNTAPPPIRFGAKAGKPCIWIGDQARVWNYPQVFVTEVVCGYYYASSFATGIVISIDSIYGSVQRTILNRDTKPVFFAYGYTSTTFFNGINPVPFVTVAEGATWFTANTLFTAPVPGVYSFNAGLLKGSAAGDTYIYLAKSDGTTGPMGYSSNADTWTQVTASWHTYMDAGQTMRVIADGPANCFYGGSSSKYHFFSGALVN